VAKLDEDQRAALIRVFGDTHATSVKRLVAEVVDAVKDFDQSDCRDFVGELLGLGALGYAQRYSFKDIAESVAKSPNLKLNPDERAILQRTLSAIMEFTTIQQLGKAFELSTAHERVFHSARIMTDSRPLFGDVDDVPVGVVITHSLIIEFHQDGRHQSIELALSDPDIELLEDVVNRASRKAESLERWARGASLNVFQLFDEVNEDEEEG
jgi:hypothetical protein